MSVGAALSQLEICGAKPESRARSLSIMINARSIEASVSSLDDRIIHCTAHHRESAGSSRQHRHRDSRARRLRGIRSSSPLSPTRSTRRSACESGWPGTSSWTCLPTRSGVYSPSRHRPPKSNSPMRTPRATEHRPFYDDELLPARSSVVDRRKLHIGIASSRIGRPASIPDRASVTPAG